MAITFTVTPAIKSTATISMWAMLEPVPGLPVWFEMDHTGHLILPSPEIVEWPKATDGRE